MEDALQIIVLATDGSAYSDASARCIADRKLFRNDICVHVVHCLPDVSGEVKAYINKQDVEAWHTWHTDESSKLMKSAIDILQGQKCKRSGKPLSVSRPIESSHTPPQSRPRPSSSARTDAVHFSTP